MSTEILVAIIASTGAVFGSFAGVTAKRFLDYKDKKNDSKKYEQKIVDIVQYLTNTEILPQNYHPKNKLLDIFLIISTRLGKGADMSDLNEVFLREGYGYGEKDKLENDVIGHLGILELIDENIIKDRFITQKYYLNSLGTEVLIRLKKNKNIAIGLV